MSEDITTDTVDRKNEIADEQKIIAHETDQKNANELAIEEYADKIMRLARDTITVRFRFFDNALAKYKLKSSPGLNGYMADGEYLYYDPEKLLKDYLDEPNIAVRVYLHILLHSIFLHSSRTDKTNEEYWNMACDVAVEYTIHKMGFPESQLTRDDEQRLRIAKLRKWVPDITAEKVYREFMVGGVSKDAEAEYKRLFCIDRHFKRVEFKPEPEMIITNEDWKKIAERVKAELKSFSENKSGDESIAQNLDEATKRRYDYASILRQFAVQGEEIMVNPDEFDNIYYTYGLKTYGNLPLIEPLEYAEVKKVREFVIAIDTSASCRGEVVKAFLNKTFDILNATDSFFSHVNIHIIQCDKEIKSDTKITSIEDLKEFIANGKLTGFGATDFRPVFSYLDELIENKAFENLKGLIYFTDGYGIYPSHCPKYDTIFAFLEEDKNRAPVPVWAMKVILEQESLID